MTTSPKGPTSGRVAVLGGRHRGRTLVVPAGARPTTGKVREAMFSMLRDWLAEAAVLDLYAGSGVVGIEALSRGATSLVLVDNAPAAAKAIRANLAKLDLTERARLVTRPVAQSLSDLRGPIDLVFADPPYADHEIDGLLVPIATLLAPGGRLVVERSSRDSPQDPAALAAAGLVSHDRRCYGESSIEVFGLVP